MTHLCMFLNTLKCSVLILKIVKNRYLNEHKLNAMLKMICQQYKNCVYVDDYMDWSKPDMCKKLIQSWISSIMIKSSSIVLIIPKNTFIQGIPLHKI